MKKTPPVCFLVRFLCPSSTEKGQRKLATAPLGAVALAALAVALAVTGALAVVTRALGAVAAVLTAFARRRAGVSHICFLVGG